MLALEWKGRAFIEKVNSRCFCWFPAAILVDRNCPPIWHLHTKLYKGVWNVLANNSENVGHKDLRFGQIVYISVFYNISFSWLLPLDGFQLNFLCRFDSKNEEFNLTHILEWAIIVWKLCSKCLEWECSRRQEFIENWQFLKYGYRIILNANLVNTEDQIWRPWQHIPFKTHPSTLLGGPRLWEEDPWMSKG